MWMADAQQVEEWNRASLLAALLAEPHRDTTKRSRPFGVEDFHPWLRARRGRRSAAELLAKLEAVDGTSFVVDETTWAPKT